MGSITSALKSGRSLSNQQLLDFCEASPSVESDPGMVDMIISFLLNSLVGQQQQHQDSRRLSLCVGCLALVVEHAAETDRILGLETNTTQLVRLCLNRGVYPEAPQPQGQMSSDPVPTPVQEVAICRRALGQLLRMGPISGSSVVRTDVVGFVRKWWQRLAATAEATGSSSPRRGSALRFEMPTSTSGSSSSGGGGGGGREAKAAVPTLRAVLQLLVVLVSTRHSWLLSHVEGVMRDLDPSFLRAYVQCGDAATASAAASLLVLLLQCACEGEGASWVAPVQNLAAHRLEQLAYRDGEAEAGLALSLLRLVCEGSARSHSTPGTPTAVLALLRRSVESQNQGEQSALTTFYALRWCHLAQQPFSQCLQALDREALAVAQQGMLALRAFSSPDDAANTRLAAEYAVEVSHALAGRSPMVSSPVPPSQGGMESPPLTQRRDSGGHWSYPDSVSRHQALASLDTTRMSEEEASDMNLSSRHSPPGSGLVRKQQQEDEQQHRQQQEEEKEEVEEVEEETSDLLEDDAEAGRAGRVGALQADNAQLRRQVLELQRELHRRDADAERDKTVRAEQAALLEDAWAKMSSVARAEAAAQAELQSAQAWAAVCQDRLLEREEVCVSLAADAAQAAGQVRAFEMRAKEEVRRSAASAASEAALREALSRAERQLEVQRGVEARLAAEVSGLESEREADAQRLHGCERALAAEQDRSAAAGQELAACREQLLRCERSLQAEAERAGAMAAELNTHRSIISHIHASINQLGGKASSKGPADNLLERLSQSLSQGEVGDHHKENAKNVV